jgi:enterobactin synthetase component D
LTPLPDPHAPFVLTGRIAQRVQRLPAGDAPDPAARRQAEYQAGRELAATLLAGLGARTVQVGADADRAPRWPEGFVGSISHSRHLLGVAVGRQADTRGLGIDLEAIADAEAIEAIEAVCMLPDEHGLVAAALPRADWATLVFSAKEALYKCQFPLTRCPLEFSDLAVVHADVTAQRLVLRLQRDAGPDFRRGQSFHCGYRLGQGHVYTAVQLAP